MKSNFISVKHELFTEKGKFRVEKTLALKNLCTVLYLIQIQKILFKNKQ